MERRTKILLGCSFGLLLGISYSPFPTGIFAFVAFVPLFIAFERCEQAGQLARFSYGSLFLFTIITLYWPGGFIHAKDYYMMIAGGILLLAQPLFYLLAVSAWHLLRKRFGFGTSLFFFPACWVSFEYLYSVSELSFPWLTLGTTQARDLPAIQFASITGVYGVSFWIICVNLGIFIIYRKLSRKEWKINSRRTFVSVLAILLAILIPRLYGGIVLSTPETQNEKEIRIGIIQPNIDPFEKWERGSDPQLDILQAMTRELAGQRPDLILWPETAIPLYVLDPRNAGAYSQVRGQIDSIGIPLLAGIPDIVYYADSTGAPRGSKRLANGVRYETFNSSMLVRPGVDSLQKYAKMLLVPFAERVPYSDVLDFLQAAKWNFGLGGWNLGREATVFRFRTSSGRAVHFSTMICYESIFPDFVARFVRGGAEFLTVLTNDSWWGRTSGPYQHVAIEIFRAIETRRWLVQCSNGGISCVIDPYGNIRYQSDLFTRTATTASIVPRTEITTFARYGDWFARVCLFVVLSLLVAHYIITFYNAQRRNANG